LLFWQGIIFLITCSSYKINPGKFEPEFYLAAFAEDQMVYKNTLQKLCKIHNNFQIITDLTIKIKKM